MGQTLSEPDTTKDTAFCENNLFQVGSSCMQGWRINMEDAHTHILSLPDDPGTAFFAVYDGHGGASVAQYAGKNLHKILTKQSQYKEGKIESALKDTFLEIDEIMKSEESLKNEQAGSTAVAVLIKDNVLYCANVGDSRAIASVNGKVKRLSFDHKPTNKLEHKRITAAGGWVEYNRVNGNLALSRALGDYGFKRNMRKSAEEQIVTAYPDVEVRTITEDWEFIVIACDGIWDVMKNDEVIDFVRQNIAAGYEPEEICEGMMMKCLAPDCLMCGLGCDNMTVVIIGLLHDKPYSDLVHRCAQPAVGSHEDDDINDTESCSDNHEDTDKHFNNVNDESDSQSDNPEAITQDDDEVVITQEIPITDDATSNEVDEEVTDLK